MKSLETRGLKNKIHSTFLSLQIQIYYRLHKQDCFVCYFLKLLLNVQRRNKYRDNDYSNLNSALNDSKCFSLFVLHL